MLERAATIKASVSLAEVIGTSLQLMRNCRLLIALCPFHTESTPSFTVYIDHFHCFGCGAHGDVFAWLMRAHRMTFRQAIAHLATATTGRPVAVAVGPQRACNSDHIDLARCIWRDAVNPLGTPVETYLHDRGFCLPETAVVRFHPRCPRKDGVLPAMVAIMTDPLTGEQCGVHRTFIREDGRGKAAIDRPKMMLGRAGVIRLSEPLGAGLGISEGIETALACIQLIGWGPVWAAGSRGMIERFPVLPETTLNIFSDADDSGEGLNAARACAARWAAAGQEVFIHIPPVGSDWADAARRLAE